MVERESRYLGVVTLYALLATTTELEIEHAAYASPLTGLPGNVVIDHEIRSALARGRPRRRGPEKRAKTEAMQRGGASGWVRERRVGAAGRRVS